MKDNEINWVKCFRKLKSIDEKEIGQHNLSFYKNIDFIWLSSLENNDMLYIMPLSYKCHKFLDSYDCGGDGAKWCTGYSKTDTYYQQFQKNCAIFVALSKRRRNDIKWLIFLAKDDLYIFNSGNKRIENLLAIEFFTKLKKENLQKYSTETFEKIRCCQATKQSIDATLYGTSKYLDWDKVFKRRHIKVCNEYDVSLYGESDYVILNSLESLDYKFAVPMNYKAYEFYNSYSSGGQGAYCCLGNKNDKSYYHLYIYKHHLTPCVVFGKKDNHNHIKYMFAIINGSCHLFNQMNEEIMGDTPYEDKVKFLQEYFSFDVEKYLALHNDRIKAAQIKNAECDDETIKHCLQTCVQYEL